MKCLSKEMCFMKCFKTIKIINCSYIDGNLFQRLGADAVNDISSKMSIKICCA